MAHSLLKSPEPPARFRDQVVHDATLARSHATTPSSPALHRPTHPRPHPLRSFSRGPPQPHPAPSPPLPRAVPATCRPESTPPPSVAMEPSPEAPPQGRSPPSGQFSTRFKAQMSRWRLPRPPQHLSLPESASPGRTTIGACRSFGLTVDPPLRLLHRRFETMVCSPTSPSSSLTPSPTCIGCPLIGDRPAAPPQPLLRRRRHPDHLRPRPLHQTGPR